MNLLITILVRVIYISLSWLCLKLGVGVGDAELTSAATWIGGGAVLLIGAGVEYVARKISKPKPPEPPAVIGKIVPFLLLPFLLVGCSNLTPQQRYDVNEAVYIGANVGLSAAHAAGKIPPKQIPGIQNDLAIAKADLDKAQAWLDANPNLANVIGLYVPELDAAATAVKIARRHLVKFALLGPLP